MFKYKNDILVIKPVKNNICEGCYFDHNHNSWKDCEDWAKEHNQDCSNLIYVKTPLSYILKKL
jgi:hypothetical protein